MSKDIFSMAIELLDENWDGRSPLRLIGAACVLAPPEPQLDLFRHLAAAETLRNESIDRLKDAVRARFGDKAICSGRDVSARPASHSRRARKE